MAHVTFVILRMLFKVLRFCGITQLCGDISNLIKPLALVVAVIITCQISI